MYILIIRNWSHNYRGWKVPRYAVNKLETQESWWCSCSLNTVRLETQERPMFSFESEGRKKPMSQFMGHQEGRIFFYSGKGQAFCSILAFHSSDWMRFTLIREDSLLYQSMELKINLIQNTPNNVWPDIWVPCDPVRWTHKINYSRFVRVMGNRGRLEVRKEGWWVTRWRKVQTGASTELPVVPVIRGLCSF